jgi:hypothetical protein
VLESARHQWEDGARRLAAEAGDLARYRQLCDLVDAVIGELRRRVGQHYSLEELAGAHAAADEWVREVVLEAAPPKAHVGIRDSALVQDAAFHAYARGAGDYRP